jgi:hypothetical protein
MEADLHITIFYEQLQYVSYAPRKQVLPWTQPLPRAGLHEHPICPCVAVDTVALPAAAPVASETTPSNCARHGPWPQTGSAKPKIAANETAWGKANDDEPANSRRLELVWKASGKDQSMQYSYTCVYYLYLSFIQLCQA